MATLVLRGVKGTFLTHTEVDNNFINLNTGKLEASNNLSDLTNTTTARSNLGANNASNLTIGTVAPARLGSGTADNTTFLRGDNTWQVVPLPAGQTAGSTSVGFLQYAGTTKTGGQTYGGTAAPDATTRLNYDGHLYATKFFGDGSGLVNAGSTLADDTTTNQSHYLGMSRITSGSWTAAYVSSSKLFFNPSTGTLNSTAFNSLSDATLKAQVAPVVNAVQTLKDIQGVSFVWKDSGKKSYGLIAQQLEAILPDLVATSESGIKTVNYSGLIAFLIEAVKSQQADIDLLKEEIINLRG